MITLKIFDCLTRPEKKHNVKIYILQMYSKEFSTKKSYGTIDGNCDKNNKQINDNNQREVLWI